MPDWTPGQKNTTWLLLRTGTAESMITSECDHMVPSYYGIGSHLAAPIDEQQACTAPLHRLAGRFPFAGPRQCWNALFRTLVQERLGFVDVEVTARALYTCNRSLQHSLGPLLHGLLCRIVYRKDVAIS